jgi:hypothetical protein
LLIITRGGAVLFVGDDWAEAHHDIEIEDEAGRVLARRRLPEGLAGITTLHELVAEHLDPTAEPDQVLIGIETDRGPWVQALLAAGYVVCARAVPQGPGELRPEDRAVRLRSTRLTSSQPPLGSKLAQGRSVEGAR